MVTKPNRMNNTDKKKKKKQKHRHRIHKVLGLVAWGTNII